jgi:hypothetical protein
MSLQDFIDNVAEQGGESEDEGFDEDTGEPRSNGVKDRRPEDFDDSSEEESEDEEAERAVGDGAGWGTRLGRLTWVPPRRR